MPLRFEPIPCDRDTNKVHNADKYNDSTGKYDQTVSLNGKVVSTLSTNDACVGTVIGHKYTGTTIILNAADNTLGNTLSLNEADSSGLTTSDNGKTWKVDTINIHTHTFNN